MLEQMTLPIAIEVQTSAQSTLAYAALADDFNGIHTDPEFAAKSKFGRPIIHGSHTLALLVDLLDRNVPDTLALRDLELRFVAPVPVGTRIFLRLEAGSESGDGLKLTADDGDAQSFAEGTARLGLLAQRSDANFDGEIS